MRWVLLFNLFFLISFSAQSQEINTDPFNNRVLQKYYTKAELYELNTNHHQKFKELKYYYIHSFTIDPVTAAACPTFNPSLFDVSDYESFRSAERSVVITTSCGVMITLLSKRELDILIHYDGILPYEPER